MNTSYTQSKSFILIFVASLLLYSCATNKSHRNLAKGENPCSDCTIMFYNVENLFDTIDDPVTEDEEFTPQAKKEWNSQRYEAKLDSLAKVISSVGTSLPIIVGFGEVENKQVLEDLIATEKLKKGNFKIVHEDSPDNRGIDVALIYRPEFFKNVTHDYITVDISSMSSRPTRDILHVTGLLPNGDSLHLFVNHWPSRYGGQETSEPKRLKAASTLRHSVEKILASNPNANIMLMGDFNDYPTNSSISDTLGASSNLQEEAMLYDLMGKMHSEGKGSYSYRGEWGFLDQIIVSKALLNGSYPDVDTAATKPLKKEWMLYTNQKSGDQSPSRTYTGSNYHAGFSDHLPVYTRISAGQ